MSQKKRLGWNATTEKLFSIDLKDVAERYRVEIKKPYQVEEVCFVPETWGYVYRVGNYKLFRIVYKEDEEVHVKIKHPLEVFSGWHSPIVMPEWVARRQVQIVEIFPMRIEDVVWQEVVRTNEVEVKYCCSGEDCDCRGLPIENPAEEFLAKWKAESAYRDWETDRKSTHLNSSHRSLSRMPSSA